jgi:hypothetical protein
LRSKRSKEQGSNANNQQANRGIFFLERAKAVLSYSSSFLFFPIFPFIFTFTFDSRHGHGMACGVFFHEAHSGVFKINILYPLYFLWIWPYSVLVKMGFYSFAGLPWRDLEQMFHPTYAYWQVE